MTRVLRLLLVGGPLAILVGCGQSTPVFNLPAQTPALPAITTPTDSATVAPALPAGPADARADLFGNASPALPAGQPGVIDVVAQGPFGGSSIPVVVRNNTANTVNSIQISGTANDATGKLVATGQSQDVYPNTVAPGQIAIGYVYFDGSTPPAGSTYSFQTVAKQGAAGSVFSKLDLTVTQANVNADGNLVGMITNPYTATVNGPIAVMVMCFTTTGHPTDTNSGFGDTDTVDPQGHDPFTISDLGACPVYLIGAQGFSE